MSKVLVLGATGFIGRSLVTYLVKEGVGEVTAVDKVLPNCAYLSKEQTECFEKAKFVQKNLISPDAVASLWEGGDDSYDFVINLAAETKYGHTDDVYAERVEHLSLTVAKETAKHKVKRFIEVSTAQVYDPNDKVSKEDSSTNPWTNIAKFKLKVEEQLKGIDGLNYVIVRPAIVYGPGDRTGIAPRIICGAVYKELKEPMKFLWNKGLKINTVHIDDVVAALWFLTSKGDNGEIYNLADSGNTDQGKVNVILEKLFDIKTGFANKLMIGMVSKLSMDKLTREVNDKHVAPWSKITKGAGISITPLSPYLDQELLHKKHLCVDGTKITKAGFTYKHPEINEAALREWVKYFTDLKLFPEGYTT